MTTYTLLFFADKKKLTKTWYKTAKLDEVKVCAFRAQMAGCQPHITHWMKGDIIEGAAPNVAATFHGVPITWLGPETSMVLAKLENYDRVRGKKAKVEIKSEA